MCIRDSAMSLVEVDGSTEPPPGGEIVRDANGRATGMMREAAQDIFRVAYSGHQGRRPAGVAEAELRRMITLAGEESLRHGITSFQDLGTTFAEVDLLKTMAEEGNLPVRLYMAFEEQVGGGSGLLRVGTIATDEQCDRQQHQGRCQFHRHDSTRMLTRCASSDVSPRASA